jgi:chemotaxis protein CheX
MTAAPTFTADDLRAVAGDVWESCLAYHGEPLEDGTGALLEGVPARAVVRIAGDWSGAVRLEMSRETAAAAARIMLDADQVEPDEVADAVGELVNIIGGNLKSLLPTPSRLGLPQVTGVMEVTTSAVVDAMGTEHCRVDLSWGNRPVRVQVWS